MVESDAIQPSRAPRGREARRTAIADSPSADDAAHVPEATLDPGLEARLRSIEAKLDELIALARAETPAKEFYTTSEVARIVGRAAWTVREWCRQGRLKAKHKAHRYGAHQEWVISHEELVRYRSHGLLPPKTKTRSR